MRSRYHRTRAYAFMTGGYRYIVEAHRYMIDVERGKSGCCALTSRDLSIPRGSLDDI